MRIGLIFSIVIILCASFVSCSKNDAPNPSGEVSKQEVKKVDIQKALEYRHEIERRGLTYDKDTFATAVQQGNREIVELFVKSGFDIHVQDSKGATVLEYAMDKNDLELVKLIVNSGYDVNYDNRGTPLMYACMLGNLELVQLLLDKGANVNFQGPEGQTALHSAISSASRYEDGMQVEIVSLLLNKGADTNVQIKTHDLKSLSLLEFTHEAKMGNPANKVWDKYIRIINILGNKPQTASVTQDNDIKCVFANAGFGAGATISKVNGKNVTVTAELAKGDLDQLTDVEAKIRTCGYQQNPFGDGSFFTCWGDTNPPVVNQSAKNNMEFSVSIPFPKSGDSELRIIFNTKNHDQDTYGKLVYRICYRY